MSRIQRPAQKQSEMYFGAFKELYHMLDKHSNKAKHNMSDIMNTYEKGLNLTIYDLSSDSNSKFESDDESEFVENGGPNIDWESLENDPQMERYCAEEMMRNHQRFIQAICDLKQFGSEMHKMNIKTNIELDVSFNTYFIESAELNCMEKQDSIIDDSTTNELQESNEITSD